MPECWMACRSVGHGSENCGFRDSGVESRNSPKGDISGTVAWVRDGSGDAEGREAIPQ